MNDHRDNHENGRPDQHCAAIKVGESIAVWESKLGRHGIAFAELQGSPLEFIRLCFLRQKFVAGPNRAVSLAIESEAVLAGFDLVD